jgi:serine/threonine protein kinase
VLVLYSPLDEVWKIADFGLTVEGTSIQAVTTSFSRGTVGYRAPELIQWPAKSTYSNKSDIWAIGCILYELIATEKAFSSDTAVHIYSQDQTLDIRFREKRFRPDDQAFLSTMVRAMLEVNPRQRPKAVEINEWFNQKRLDRENPSEPSSLFLSLALSCPPLFVKLIGIFLSFICMSPIMIIGIIMLVIKYRRRFIWHSTQAIIFFSILRYFSSIILDGHNSDDLYRIIFLEICLLQALNKWFVHINLPVSDPLAKLT